MRTRIDIAVVVLDKDMDNVSLAVACSVVQWSFAATVN